MWDCSACQTTLATVGALYPDPWGGDHLALFHLLLQDGIKGPNAPEFHQRIIASTRDYIPRPKPTFAGMTDRNDRFAAACRAMIAAADLTPTERSEVLAVLPFCVSALPWQEAGVSGQGPTVARAFRRASFTGGTA